MTTSPTAQTLTKAPKNNSSRTGTIISRRWCTNQDLAFLIIRPDGGNKNGSDDVNSGPMLPWPMSNEDDLLAEHFRPDAKVVYEVEEAGGEKRVDNVREGGEEGGGGELLQIKPHKNNPSRTGTIISRTWRTSQDLALLKVRPDGGNKDGSDDVSFGPMLPWPMSNEDDLLAEHFRPDAKVVYEVEEAGGEKRFVNVREEGKEGVWGEAGMNIFQGVELTFF
ncbi:hypothetical protein N7G274_009967 [Stereocaulon virgatum]|uniref:Uncharacterized protein n=1 Tax=Stereocaulon virgatum TaxID=373712 RepID=A0ABR3ZWZ7_9LECA